MNIEEIYKNKRHVITQKMDKVFSEIFNNIEKDKDFSLSDEEISELAIELVMIWLKENTSAYEWQRITTTNYKLKEQKLWEHEI